MPTTISIIIPCFNSGIYLPDAIASVKAYKGNYTYEIIIVNDGSTDVATMQLLTDIEAEDVIVIHQDNKGPAAARNEGVKNCSADYVLFLDSDNKIRTALIDKAVALFEADPSIDIIYAEPEFFGADAKARFKTGPFDFDKILVENYIDMCSVVRKKTWNEMGGLDENRLIIGHEDWEFWIRAGASGRIFHFIPEVLFDYRVVSNSLVTQAISTEKVDRMFSYIYGKHYNVVRNKLRFYQNDNQRPFRTLLKNLYHRFKR